MLWSPGALSVEFLDVPRRHLFFSVILYTLTHFWLSAQKLNTNLNNLFHMNIKFDELLGKIDNVLQKMESLTLYRIISLKSPFLLIFTQRSVTTLRNNKLIPADFMSVVMTSFSNLFLNYDVLQSVIISEI